MSELICNVLGHLCLTYILLGLVWAKKSR